MYQSCVRQRRKGGSKAGGSGWGVGSLRPHHRYGRKCATLALRLNEGTVLWLDFHVEATSLTTAREWDYCDDSLYDIDTNKVLINYTIPSLPTLRRWQTQARRSGPRLTGRRTRTKSEICAKQQNISRFINSLQRILLNCPQSDFDLENHFQFADNLWPRISNLAIFGVCSLDNYTNMCYNVSIR